MKNIFSFMAIVVSILILSGCASLPPLHRAAFDNDVSTARSLVVNKKVDVNSVEPYGSTSLMVAAGFGRTDMVKFLLENGADVNRVDSYGQTALMGAAGSGLEEPTGREEIVRLLIASGADVSARDHNGKTALDHAKERNHPKIADLIAPPKQIEAVAVQEKTSPLPELTDELKTLVTQKDMQGLRTYLDAHPENLPAIEDRYLRLLFTGPAGLRIIDITQLVKSKKKDAIIIAKINSTSGGYKNFTDDEMADLQKMNISDEVVATMITVTAEYDKEQKRLAEQRRVVQAVQQVQPIPVVAQAESNTPAECLKLIAALKACDQTGGFLQMGCKGLARSQFNCPNAERYMR